MHDPSLSFSTQLSVQKISRGEPDPPISISCLRQQVPPSQSGQFLTIPSLPSPRNLFIYPRAVRRLDFSLLLSVGLLLPCFSPITDPFPANTDLNLQFLFSFFCAFRLEGPQPVVHLCYYTNLQKPPHTKTKTQHQQ